MNCDLCDKPAVVHEVILRHGVKQELHLCEDHAKEQGYTLPGEPPLEKILQQFVMASEPPTPKVSTTLSCDACGLTLAEFRRTGNLGCPECYESFGRGLEGIIQRAQNGGTHHVGRTPRGEGAGKDRQLEIGRLVKDLEDAVAAEEFERAASLRDRLRRLETEVAGERSSEPPAGGENGGG
jgi:protein arginine kinase activator